MKLYDNQVHKQKGYMVIDDYHYVKYAKLSLIRVFILTNKILSLYCDSVHMQEISIRESPYFGILYIV